jgi:hypothetical protein
MFGLMRTIMEDIMPTNGSASQRRTAKCFPWKNDVELTWTMPDGTAIRERTFTQMVSASGALLKMRFFWKDLPYQGEVHLKNRSSGKSARMRVVEIKPAVLGGLADVTVQFV